ncbi:hypothetical protein GQ42DRAFT_156586 [Ramicandelaber brevisporus]|nr:hypothetical protein GQ42DRAFT_156586 [Ramicandelaber brevisporus]
MSSRSNSRNYRDRDHASARRESDRFAEQSRRRSGANAVTPEAKRRVAATSFRVVLPSDEQQSSASSRGGRRTGGKGPASKKDDKKSGDSRGSGRGGRASPPPSSDAMDIDSSSASKRNRRRPARRNLKDSSAMEDVTLGAIGANAAKIARGASRKSDAGAGGADKPKGKKPAVPVVRRAGTAGRRPFRRSGARKDTKPGPTPSAEDLDRELDSYMNNTSSAAPAPASSADHLDIEMQ